MSSIKFPSVPSIALVIWLLGVIVFSVIFYYLIEDLVKIYQTKFQVPLFAGFLTLGSFLLTLKSFVIIQFKKELFEKPYYKAAHHALYGKFIGKTFYAPLNHLAQLLLISVIASLITSVSQLTVGFIPVRAVSALCMGLAIATLIEVGFVWLLVRRNVLKMFEWWEKDLNEENNIQSKH